MPFSNLFPQWIVINRHNFLASIVVYGGEAMVGDIVLYNVIPQMGEISPKNGPEPNWFLMYQWHLAASSFLTNSPSAACGWSLNPLTHHPRCLLCIRKAKLGGSRYEERALTRTVFVLHIQQFAGLSISATFWMAKAQMCLKLVVRSSGIMTERKVKKFQPGYSWF